MVWINVLDFKYTYRNFKYYQNDGNVISNKKKYIKHFSILKEKGKKPEGK